MKVALKAWGRVKQGLCAEAMSQKWTRWKEGQFREGSCSLEALSMQRLGELGDSSNVRPAVCESPGDE